MFGEITGIGESGRVRFCYSYDQEALVVMVSGPAHVIVCVGVETRTIVVLAV